MHITSSLETRNTKFLLNICVQKKKALGNENISQALPMYNVYYSEETFFSNLYFPKVVKGSDSEWYKKIVQMHKMKNGARLSYIFQVRYHKNTDYYLHTQ